MDNITIDLLIDAIFLEMIEKGLIHIKADRKESKFAIIEPLLRKALESIYDNEDIIGEFCCEISFDLDVYENCVALITNTGKLIISTSSQTRIFSLRNFKWMKYIKKENVLPYGNMDNHYIELSFKNGTFYLFIYEKNRKNAIARLIYSSLLKFLPIEYIWKTNSDIPDDYASEIDEIYRDSSERYYNSIDLEVFKRNFNDSVMAARIMADYYQYLGYYQKALEIRKFLSDEMGDEVSSLYMSSYYHEIENAKYDRYRNSIHYAKRAYESGSIIGGSKLTIYYSYIGNRKALEEVKEDLRKKGINVKD